MRRISSEGRLQDYHFEVGRLWRSRGQELEPEVFEQEPDWMAPPAGHRETQFDLERVLPGILETLTRREHKILWLRFWADYTLEEVGACFHLSRDRIRQIEAKALRKLRHPSRSDVLRPLFDFCPVVLRRR